MKNLNYIGKAKSYPQLGYVRFSFLHKGLFLLFFLYALPVFGIKAQHRFIPENEITPLAYDAIPVHVIVEGYGTFYVDVIYTKNKLLYVNIDDLFKTLNIPSVVGQKGNSLSGFIEKESRTYSINYETKQIKVGTTTINAKDGLRLEMGTLYMESSLFAEAFGITLTFNYRILTIILKSNFELPIIKEMRNEKMRSNMSKVKGEVFVDTTLQRNYHLFKFGTLDWSVASSQTGNESTDNHFGLGIGTELLYGEADISVDYYNQYKFDNRQLQYLWRWVDNDKSIIKQAEVGKISTQTISFINSPIIGAVIRNSPTTVRKATGYYTINEFTEPNWNVELYINNVLVDFTKADASGLYIFKVPNVYGYTTLKLKFYGPLGEERTEERTMNVPYTIMPVNEFEYGLSAGIVEDSISSRFGKAEFNYGVNRILTIGGGLEYLSSISNGPFIPYATATLQPFSRLTLNAEYAYGVKAGGLLNYYFMKDALLEIDYTKYVEGQLATRFNADEERKIIISIPFMYKKIIGFAKIDYTQLVYKTFNYNQSDIMFSAYYKQFSANTSTQLNWVGNKPAYIISDLALSYRMRNGYTIRPSAEYNINENKFNTYKLAIEKYIPKGLFSISYERNMLFNDNFINLNFKYDLTFARTNIYASHSKNNVNISESAQGSLAFGSGNKYIYGSNNSSMSKGGISLYPFLDLNNNGIFDPGEPMVKITSVGILGGKIIFSKKDSIVRIPDLNAFTNYVIEFSDNDLENIAWRFKKKVYKVLIDPNQFKRIDIPIIAVGEVSGMVYLNDDNLLKGLRRISVKFYKKNSDKVVAQILSESDGYIYYLGLEPGEYIARIDPGQLNNLKMVSSPEQIPIKISQSFEGDIVSNLDFILSLVKEPISDTANSIAPTKPTVVVTIPRDTVKIITTNANYNSAKKIKNLQVLLAKNIDLLIVLPNESEPLTPIVKEVYKKGIPVILIDRKIEPEDYTAFIGANNYQIGKETGKYAAKLLKGKGQILEVMGLIDYSPALERQNGFNDVISKFPEIKVVKSKSGEWENHGGWKIMGDTVSKKPQYNLVYAHNDRKAMGTYNAFIKEKKRKNFNLISSDIKNKKPFHKENDLNTMVIDSANLQPAKSQSKEIITRHKNITFAKQNRDIQVQHHDIQAQRFYSQQFWLIVSLCSLALVIVLVLLFRRYRNK